MVLLFKVFALTVRTLSKPMAKSLKKKAKEHPMMRDMVVSFANFYQRWETRLSVRMLGHKVTKIRPMQTDKAVEKGADIIGETFVYSVAMAFLGLDYVRKIYEDAEKAERSKMKDKQFKDDLAARFASLELELRELKDECAELRGLVDADRGENPPASGHTSSVPAVQTDPGKMAKRTALEPE
ncbi:MAG: hypothetical protein MHM6MM_004828 [Cercozoa sp. M6MM]